MLDKHVKTELLSCSYRRDAQCVAFQLIASTFYFSRIGLQVVEGTNRHTCKGLTQGHLVIFLLTNFELGIIRCRFESNSPLMRELGKVLQLQLQYRPVFVVREQLQDRDVLKVS